MANKTKIQANEGIKEAIKKPALQEEIKAFKEKYKTCMENRPESDENEVEVLLREAYQLIGRAERKIPNNTVTNDTLAKLRAIAQQKGAPAKKSTPLSEEKQKEFLEKLRSAAKNKNAPAEKKD